jgi:hypothetical protein
MKIINKLYFIFIFALPITVCAEVMDKEMSVADIWRVLLWALLIALIAGFIWRWLLIPSFFIGGGMGLSFAWTEWYDPYVGPAILNEAGSSYGFHINTAISILLLFHILLWFLTSRFSVVSIIRGRPKVGKAKDRKNILYYSICVAGITALSASGGFGASASIWASPPIFIDAIFLCWASFTLYRTIAIGAQDVQHQN